MKLKPILLAVVLAVLAAPAFASGWATPYTWTWATGPWANDYHFIAPP